MIDRYESEESIFDGFLLQGYKDDAYDWALELSEKKPWSAEIKGYLAFSLLILGHKESALDQAERALGLSPYNEWALAVKFACSNNREIEAESVFFKYDGFRLDGIWFYRFDCLGLPDVARRFWGFIARFGPEEDKQALLEDVFGVNKWGGRNL